MAQRHNLHFCPCLQFIGRLTCLHIRSEEIAEDIRLIHIDLCVHNLLAPFVMVEQHGWVGHHRCRLVRQTIHNLLSALLPHADGTETVEESTRRLMLESRYRRHPEARSVGHLPHLFIHKQQVEELRGQTQRSPHLVASHHHGIIFLRTLMQSLISHIILEQRDELPFLISLHGIRPHLDVGSISGILLQVVSTLEPAQYILAHATSPGIHHPFHLLHQR